MSGNTTTNTITGTATETQTVVATLTPPTTPQCTLTLSYSESTQLQSGGPFTYGDSNGHTASVNQGSQYMAQGTFGDGTTTFDARLSATYGWDIQPSTTTATATASIDGKANTAPTYTATLTVMPGTTLAVTGDPGGTLPLSGISYSYQSNTPNTNFTQPISGLANGDTFSWNKPAAIVNTNYNANLVSFSTDIAGSSAATFPYGGTMGSADQPNWQVFSQGNIVYTAPVTTNFVTMNWTSVIITDNSGDGYTLSPPAYISGGPGTAGDSGNAAVNSIGWTIAPGAASVVLNKAGQYFSSGGTPSNTNALLIDGTAQMPATNAPNGTTSDWTVTGTVDWIPVTIEVTYSLNSNATYYVTFSGQTSKTFTVYNGSGAHTQASFLVSASNIVNFSLGRTGSTWCTPTSYSLCSQYMYGCGSQYGCSAYIPEGDGSWQAKLNGTGVNPYLQTWTKGNADLYSRSGQFAALSSGDTLTIDITEN